MPRPRSAPKIDPSSPVPLYHQIAEAIRARIRAGELSEGDALEPLREAAEAWGVNLHTVRHAYTELARDGLVSIERKRGTRVTKAGPSGPNKGRSKGALESFIAEVTLRAKSEFGMTPGQLATRLKAGGAPGCPDVYVAECSLWECQSHVRELESRYKISAAPFVLGEETALPEGDIIATHFHSNEIRRRWPRRLDDIQFVRTKPAPELLDELGVRRRKKPLDVVLCELDQVTAGTLASDLESIVREGTLRVRTHLVDEPNEAEGLTGDSPVLLSPRMWERLSPEGRSNPRLHEIRYVFDEQELEDAARRFAWRQA